jgi:hypothetical protein
MAKLNRKQIDVNLSKFKQVNRLCYDLASKKLEDGKTFFLNEFNSHPVTKEIDAGESSLNISGTLGGRGNLFSFIGFENGSKPLDVVKFLIKKIRIVKKIKSKKILRNGFSVGVSFFVPPVSEFEKNTPMPWTQSRSWLLGIEKGISGFSYFISKALAGRSGGGVQSSEKVYSGGFKNVSYFSKMYSNFFRRVKSKK